MSEQHPRPTEQLWTLATALANAITGRHSSNDERAGYSHEEECPMWQFYRLVLDRPAPPT